MGLITACFNPHPFLRNVLGTSEQAWNHIYIILECLLSSLESLEGVGIHLKNRKQFTKVTITSNSLYAYEKLIVIVNECCFYQGVHVPVILYLTEVSESELI